MWYVVQVCTGTEESIRTQCQKKLSPPVMKDCFIPYYEEKKDTKENGTPGKESSFRAIFLPSVTISKPFRNN